MTVRQRLRERLTSGPMIVAPGIYDAFGARFVEQAGFEAVYLTGNGVSASLLGRPDVGLIDLTLMIELSEAVGKIEAALAARRDPDFLIIARTDSADGQGLDEAIRRAQAFRKAGADVIFVEMKSGPTILEDLKRLTSEADAPCLVNMGAGGKLDELTPDDIGRLGLRIAIYPGLARAAAGFAIREALSALRRDGNTRALRGRMLGLREYNEALKLDEVEEWERKYLK